MFLTTEQMYKNLCLICVLTIFFLCFAPQPVSAAAPNNPTSTPMDNILSTTGTVLEAFGMSTLILLTVETICACCIVIPFA
jgi:hypothetical protein